MSSISSLGTLIYYLGFAVMIIGFFSLATGVSGIFSQISEQMKSTYSQSGGQADSIQSPDTSALSGLQEY